MANIRRSQESNFKPRPQKRKKGTGTGRPMFPWKSKYPWLVIAAEQLFVVNSGSEGALLEDRQWSLNWNISPQSLAKELEELFPGIGKHLDSLTRNHETPWPELLKNRVYKMYYSGTSDRGNGHDPITRATISREHWRYWDSRKIWESKVLQIVSRRSRFRGWRRWLK